MRGKGFQSPDPIRERRAERQLSEPPCHLDHNQRAIVEQTIVDHCRIRGWRLFVVNCRTNHVHVVVEADRHPEEVRNQFKAWCTRKLKELEQARGGAVRENWWTERGREGYIGDEQSLEEAVQYVRDAQ